MAKLSSLVATFFWFSRRHSNTKRTWLSQAARLRLTFSSMQLVVWMKTVSCWLGTKRRISVSGSYSDHQTTTLSHLWIIWLFKKLYLFVYPEYPTCWVIFGLKNLLIELTRCHHLRDFRRFVDGFHSHGGNSFDTSVWVAASAIIIIIGIVLI